MNGALFAEGALAGGIGAIVALTAYRPVARAVRRCKKREAGRQP